MVLQCPSIVVLYLWEDKTIPKLWNELILILLTVAQVAIVQLWKNKVPSNFSFFYLAHLTKGLKLKNKSTTNQHLGIF